MVSVFALTSDKFNYLSLDPERWLLSSPTKPKIAITGSGWITILNISDSVLKIELQMVYKLGQFQNECAREAGEILHLSHVEFTSREFDLYKWRRCSTLN